MIREEVNLTANIEGGKIDINDSAVRDAINSMLDGITNHCFLTPYIALERVSKVLANFHIFLPRYTFMEGESGLATFPVHQFGEKVGMMDDGSVVTKAASPFTLWFEYQMNDDGKYDVFCAIADDEELDELHADLNDELEALAEATLAGPETGPRRKPGANEDSEPSVDMDYEDVVDAHNKTDEIRSIVRAAIDKAMKPGLKFAGKEAGPNEKASSLSESKKKSLIEYTIGKELDAAGFTKDKRTNQEFINKTLGQGFKAGSAKSNIALRDYIKNKSKPENSIPSSSTEKPTLSTPASTPKFNNEKPTKSNQINPLATVYSPQDPKLKVKGANAKMQGGLLDAIGKPVKTLTDYVTGKADKVTVAIDRKSPNFRKTGTIDASKGLNFNRNDPTYPGDSESGTPPGLVRSTIYGKIPIQATDTGSAFKGKGDTRVDIPVQSNRPDIEGAKQPISKKNVNISFDDMKNTNRKIANIDEEDNETVAPKTSSTQQPTQSDREAGLATLKQGMMAPHMEKLKQGLAARQKEAQERVDNTVDYLKKQDFINRKTNQPPKKGQYDI